MTNKFTTAILLLSLTALVAMADVWILNHLLGLMRAFHNMDSGDDDPEPSNRHVVWALFLVNTPLVLCWIAFFMSATNHHKNQSSRHSAITLIDPQQSRTTDS